MEWRPGRQYAGSNVSRDTTPGSSLYNSQESNNWTLYKRSPLRHQQHYGTNRSFIQPQRRHAQIPPHGYRERNRPGLTFSDDGEALIDGLNAVYQLSHPMRPSYSGQDIRYHWTYRTRYPILPIGNYYRSRQWYPSIDKIRNFDKFINKMVSDPDLSKYTPPGPPGFNALGPSQLTAPGPIQFMAAGPPQFPTSGPPQFTVSGPFPSTSYQQRPGPVQQRKSKSARWRERRAARWAVRKAERRAAREAEQCADLTALYPYCPWQPVSPPAAFDAQEQTYELYDVQGFGEHGETQPFKGAQSGSEVQMMALLDINDPGEPRHPNE